MKPLLLAILMAIPPVSALAQKTGPCDGPAAIASASTFVECARSATERYRDQGAAILDGYRRIGRDFPAMGEHWIRITLVFDGRFDPTRPEILNYAVIDGRPRLLGVAYAMPLLAGEMPPATPGGSAVWHDHFRTIEDETVLPHHDLHGGARDAPRIAMMHAWLWADNPEGMFAADNWAIPFLRLGIAQPPNAPMAAAKALSLVTGGMEFVESSIDAAAPGATRRARVLAGLAQARASVESLVHRTQEGTLSETELTTLGRTWGEMWDAIDTSLSAESRRQLLPIR